MSGASDCGGSTRRAGESESAGGESVEHARERLSAEWSTIASSRRLFIALGEAGARELLSGVAGTLSLAAREIASPECRPQEVLLELVAERLEELADENAPLIAANKDRKEEGLRPLLLEPWLGPIHEIGLCPYERIELATTAYEIWVEASAMIGEASACEIILRAFPHPPEALVQARKIPGYLVGRSKAPADRNPRHWPNKMRGSGPGL